MLDDVSRKGRREFNRMRNVEFGELEPTIITGDGEDKFVVMSLDNFVRMRAFKQGGEMCRIQGKIFREVQ